VVGTFSSWRWSDVSEADAKTQAEAAARALEARHAAGELRDGGHGYYSERPFREPVLREFPGSDGKAAAVVTRNVYGCEVLNAARALIVDVDFPDPEKAPKAASSGGLFGRLFGKAPAPEPAASPEAEALTRVRSWLQANPTWSWRIYRTKAGLRLLATHDVFEPQSSAVEMAFDQLQADPLYRKLCRAQQCFRARLTPKPWRCGQKAAPRSWPWVNAALEREFNDWQSKYETARRGFATCQFIKTEGSGSTHPDLAPLIAFHDEATGALSNAALA
jgi:hypothetical protein